MRQATSILLLALLVLPLWDAIRLARMPLELWDSLRARHGEALDSGMDRSYGELRPYLPLRGRVGLVQSAPPGTPGQQREYFFLQYALAPRLLVPGTDEEFVIMCGPASAAGSLLDLSRFVAVRQFDKDFTLYRRVRS